MNTDEAILFVKHYKYYRKLLKRAKDSLKKPAISMDFDWQFSYRSLFPIDSYLLHRDRVYNTTMVGFKNALTNDNKNVKRKYLDSLAYLASSVLKGIDFSKFDYITAISPRNLNTPIDVSNPAYRLEPPAIPFYSLLAQKLGIKKSQVASNLFGKLGPCYPSQSAMTNLKHGTSTYDALLINQNYANPLIQLNRIKSKNICVFSDITQTGLFSERIRQLLREADVNKILFISILTSLEWKSVKRILKKKYPVLRPSTRADMIVDDPTTYITPEHTICPRNNGVLYQLCDPRNGDDPLFGLHNTIKDFDSVSEKKIYNPFFKTLGSALDKFDY